MAMNTLFSSIPIMLVHILYIALDMDEKHCFKIFVMELLCMAMVKKKDFPLI